MNLSRLLRLALLLAALAVAANAGPVLSSLNPPYIQAGGPDVTLTVGGSGFVQGSTVYLSSIALATSYVDSTKITAVIPASLSALSVYREITVHNPDGSASPYLYFDVQPVLTGVTPNSAPAGSPTTSVTITGIGFAHGVSLEFVTASSPPSIFSVTSGVPPPSPPSSTLRCSPPPAPRRFGSMTRITPITPPCRLPLRPPLPARQP